MLSRVADSVYWISAYLERAENVARFIDTNLNLMLDLGDGIDEQWQPLIDTTGDYEPFEHKYGRATRENVFQFLIFDRENSNSILSCLEAARENARMIREIIPSVMWEEINKFYLLVRNQSRRDQLDDARRVLDQVKLSSQTIVGIADSTMSRGEAWHFARMGRLLERADKTSRILDVKYFLLLPSADEVGSPVDVIQWGALLNSASALEMYRKVRGRITPTAVADFLILHRHFPRSMHFCLIEAELSLHAITGSAPGTFQNDAEQQLGRLRSEFDFVRVEDIVYEGLHEFVDRFQQRLIFVGQAIFDTFFATRPAPGLVLQEAAQ